jgi:hypothetical protein
VKKARAQKKRARKKRKHEGKRARKKQKNKRKMHKFDEAEFQSPKMLSRGESNEVVSQHSR